MTAFQGLAAATHSTIHNAMSGFQATVGSFQKTVLNMESLFTRGVARGLSNVPLSIPGATSQACLLSGADTMSQLRSRTTLVL
jgi:hypothetical protein